MTALPYSVTRAERSEQVATLRAQGLTHQQIADRLGIARSYVANLITDPDGSKERARKRRYAGTCTVCGGPTDGSNGPAAAPTICAACFREQNAAKHGTRSRYSAGCACDDCRRANREHQRTLQGQPAPTHGVSGYTNYGCRCQKCRDAHLVYMRSKDYEHQKAWAKRAKGKPPPKHGTEYAYSTYACRCDECRAAHTAYARERRQARQDAA